MTHTMTYTLKKNVIKTFSMNLKTQQYSKNTHYVRMYNENIYYLNLMS